MSGATVPLKPLADLLLVKVPQLQEKKTEGGIILPQEMQPRPKEGTVLAVGPDVKGVKPGEVVIFGALAGEDLSDPDDERIKDIRVMHERDLIAVKE